MKLKKNYTLFFKEKVMKAKIKNISCLYKMKEASQNRDVDERICRKECRRSKLTARLSKLRVLKAFGITLQTTKEIDKIKSIQKFTLF